MTWLLASATKTPGPCLLPTSLLDKISRNSFSRLKSGPWSQRLQDKTSPPWACDYWRSGSLSQLPDPPPPYWTPLPPTHCYLLMHFDVEPVGHFIVLQRKGRLVVSTVAMDVQLHWVTLGLPIAPRHRGITAGPRASQLLAGPEREHREESRTPLPPFSPGGGVDEQCPETPTPQRCPGAEEVSSFYCSKS